MESTNVSDDISEPDYDHLNYHVAKEINDDDGMKKKGETPPPAEDYILGTLVVRVVAARNLAVASTRSVLRNRLKTTTINPYASVKFMGQTQITMAVFDVQDPVWPRSETMYLDVALPAYQVSHRSAAEIDDRLVADGGKEDPNAHVSVSLFNTSKEVSGKYPSGKKSGAKDCGDSNDPFLGTAILDVTPLLTGKKLAFDTWISLSGGEGSVRIVCEYEASDPSPRVGDIVSFTRFCRAADLYPVPITLTYRVQELNHDDIVLQYTTPEGWMCTFIAHRYMVICEERHQAMINAYQEELASVQERLAFSPMFREVELSVKRVPDDGLLDIGLGALQGAGSLVSRWLDGGIDTVKEDLQYATNWDGRFNEIVELNAPDSPEEATVSEVAELPHIHGSTCNDDDNDALPGMPECPITGEPMREPVVAADGHTYERRAIARWLETSDKSPLTGAVLYHKNLVPNYVLLTSIQEANSAMNCPKRQALESEEEEDTKMPAVA
mmetsp:Transcript_26722/g.39522  ORF Transcript_26722/g.39522 Transcript_26722/m.39522 type:complete len:497 (-) Transcript_26722:32-1522(-)|eukprot:CAMPEP_0194257992 /NCGR_PEP_ID=MMETSP0158-20130606/40324_1 /TAXON_ID=33649 /ORGANISM="Thalassionema nitzschioides, Strain L26-B" /LENGTH=496 /DNA_ID=CAMNT_0038997231 /DNA_START=19 /DNA_END=1509 /DNA_ORIENTATION=-